MEATLMVVVVEVSAQMEGMEVLMALVELEVLVALGDAEPMDLEALEALVEGVGVLVDYVGQEDMELVVMGLVMAVVALGMVAMVGLVGLVVLVVQMAAATVAVDMAAREALHSQAVRWILAHQQEDIPSMAKVEKLMALGQRVEEDMDPVELMAMDLVEPMAMDPVELMAMDLVEPMDRVDQVELMDQADMEMDLELVVMAAVWAMDLVAKVEKEGAKATCRSKSSPERFQGLK